MVEALLVLVVTSFSNYSSVNAAVGSSFFFAFVDGNGVLGFIVVVFVIFE